MSQGETDRMAVLEGELEAGHSPSLAPRGVGDAAGSDAPVH